jgi:hypothetical protein
LSVTLPNITVPQGGRITAWARVQVKNSGGAAGSVDLGLVLQGVGTIDRGGMIVNASGDYKCMTLCGALTNLSAGVYTIIILANVSVDMALSTDPGGVTESVSIVAEVSTA